MTRYEGGERFLPYAENVNTIAGAIYGEFGEELLGEDQARQILIFQDNARKIVQRYKGLIRNMQALIILMDMDEALKLYASVVTAEILLETRIFDKWQPNEKRYFLRKAVEIEISTYNGLRYQRSEHESVAVWEARVKKLQAFHTRIEMRGRPSPPRTLR